jgi:hypothetical protein
MITQTGEYYIYRHIRTDKNVPFYVGIGAKSKKDVKYSYYNRAVSKSGRSNLWKNIVAKTDYTVEILLESDDYDFIKRKEVEFIKLYGRIDLGTGTLVNLTEGGEGCKGYKHKQESLEKMSELKKGKPNPTRGIRRTAEQNKINSESHKGIIYNLSEEELKRRSEATKKRWEDWRKTNQRKPKSAYYKNYYKKVEFDKRTLGHTEETKQKIREKRAKQVITESHRESLRKAQVARREREKLSKNSQ